MIRYSRMFSECKRFYSDFSGFLKISWRFSKISPRFLLVFWLGSFLVYRTYLWKIFEITTLRVWGWGCAANPHLHPPWLMYFHYLSMFFIFFWFLKSYSERAWKTESIFFWHTLFFFFFPPPPPPYMELRGRKICFFEYLTQKITKTRLQTTIFLVFLIGKVISHITKCILDFLMVLPGWLRTIIRNTPLAASYNKSDFSLPKFHFLRILTSHSEWTSDFASNNASFIKIWEKFFFKWSWRPLQLPNGPWKVKAVIRQQKVPDFTRNLMVIPNM
jgi:hypothetical protein